MKRENLIAGKRGDIPTLTLVLGVFLVCTSALVSFYVSSVKTEKIFTGFGLVEEMNTEIEKYYFYKNLGEYSESKIEEILYVKKDAKGNRYIELEELKDGKRMISVRYYLHG